jgi:hypothetical protein
MFLRMGSSKHQTEISKKTQKKASTHLRGRFFVFLGALGAMPQPTRIAH